MGAIDEEGREMRGPAETRAPSISWAEPALTSPAGPGVIHGSSCDGQVAQLVEQRTENPRVGGSIPPLATTNLLNINNIFLEQF